MDRVAQGVVDPIQDRSVMTVADLVVDYLRVAGVEYVFGVPGGGIEPFFDAFARRERLGGPRIITVRHESGGAFMAEGYARETGRIGVCIATAGPGATNQLTGVASAHENRVPLLALTGQSALSKFGRRAVQESSSAAIDVMGIYAGATIFNALVSSPAQVETMVTTALMRASQLRGPAHLAIPVDVQREQVIGALGHQSLRQLCRAPVFADSSAVEDLVDLLRRASNPILVIGERALAAARRITDLADWLDCPFVTTPDAKGLIDPYHRQFRGVFGFAGHASANEALAANRDLVVVFGSPLGEVGTAGWSKAILNDRLVHVDAIPDYFPQSPMARLHVCGDLEDVVARLQEALPPRPAGSQEVLSVNPAEDAAEAVGGDKLAPGVSPEALLGRISTTAPSNLRLFADSGNSMAWAIHCLRVRDRRGQTQALPGARLGPYRADRRGRPRSWLNVSLDFGAMGWAIGAAIGSAFANRGGPVICLTGDGSLLMNGQEMTVAQAERLPVIFIVLNDSALGMVMHGQRLAGAEAVGYELPPVDFAAFATAMGVKALTIAQDADLDDLDVSAFDLQGGPLLVDVRIDRDATPPMAVRSRTLQAN
ncbi:MAG: thiamine pyrophosphate-binding protein [Zoogloeaceae bacterium]|nr:thiamine pyrophosphate-binding protein [Zoogloeaceae bacterium]